MRAVSSLLRQKRGGKHILDTKLVLLLKIWTSIHIET